MNDITVPYSIMWSDWGVSGTQNSAIASIPFKVAYSDHVAFITQVMGYPQKVAGVGTVAVPLLYPFASSAYLYAQSFDVKWLGSIGPSGVVEQVQPLSVVVNVGFSTVNYETDTSNGTSVAMVSIDVDYGGSFVTNPGSGYKFETSGKPVDKGVGKFVPETTYKITLHNLTVVDESLFEEYLSKVNADQFQVTVAGITIDRAPGCILFAGANSKHQGTLADDKYQVELTFLARPAGYEFNKLFDPSTGEWDYVVVDTGAEDTESDDVEAVNSIYEEIDMMGIFSGDGGE